ncbi:hypothetical protein J7W19_29065 [Streptomyces mobaraensis NBRC 13819 = DSM 40847]|uniref:Uncharacterized protein n=1 Tax=Streptomyces mobaraensis (strain ATCC 29032 / DSM 40847 / JCM 4168 / NBRC 13819 / NCIMB 11159 / IPCR 16-22) TaxID=1223523 RepID=M3CFF1_STRM1|nr:hypothetical protein [Streptomyces mobaraensis]EMF02461.1 hypothetical protein H340_01404 [Streptomyces mobaraensis NBRC 13819 = DSM 40847]QTT76889.1 hypothetical protein J7W19_29065 [Streptomyces mobaraensis NBRC 13819 = DSM 40847]
MPQNPYEVRIYKWRPMGDYRYDDPGHPLHTTHSLKYKGFRPYIVAKGIPAVDIQYSFKLDDIGQATVTIPLDGPEEWQPELKKLSGIEPYHYCLGIVRKSEEWDDRQDGYLVWSGIIWNMRMDMSDRTLQMHARDFMSFYETRNHSGVLRREEQIDLIRGQMWGENVNWGINTEYNQLVNTGRKYEWNAQPGEWREIAHDFYDMADDLNGFFLLMDSARANEGQPDEYLRCWLKNTRDRTPQWATGRDGKPLPALRDRVNCEVPEIYFDGTQIATTSYAIGRSGNLPIRRRKDNTLLRREVPVRDVVGRFDRIGDAKTLDSRAETQLAFGNKGIRVPRVITYPSAYQDPQTLNPNLGVKINLEANTGFIDIKEPFVVTENRVRVEGDGTDRCELTLVQESLFKKGKWE